MSRIKIYYTYDQLKNDLPSLRDTEIFIASDFEKTINLNTYDYKSLLAQIKRKKIKIKLLRIYESKGDELDYE